jgi:hypothetical protein
MIKEKIQIITTPVWSLKEIMLFANVKSKTTATQIKKRAIKHFNGTVKYGSQFVKRDAVLEMFNTTAERELKILYETIQKSEI